MILIIILSLVCETMKFSIVFTADAAAVLLWRDIWIRKKKLQMYKEFINAMQHLLHKSLIWLLTFD